MIIFTFFSLVAVIVAVLSLFLITKLIRNKKPSWTLSAKSGKGPQG